MHEEYIAAEDLLDRAGLLDAKLPIPLDSVIEYLAKDGLELHYYDPKLAPEPIKNAAYGRDEVLIRQGDSAVLYVNKSRPWTRQRFSICHGRHYRRDTSGFRRSSSDYPRFGRESVFPAVT